MSREMQAARQNASIVTDNFIELDEETEMRPGLPQATPGRSLWKVSVPGQK